MVEWTEERLSTLPVNGGYRLRGLEMTRIEVFADAAFAFAVTMLVISVDAIPGTYSELIDAIRRVPSFAASFAVMTAIWLAHRRWSQRFGLEDGASTFLTLALVFVVLIYLYPLKLIMDLMFYGFSQTWFPTGMAVASGAEAAGLVAIFCAGFFLVAAIQLGLYMRVSSMADALCLNELEQLLVQKEQQILAVQCVLGLLATAIALVFRSSMGYLAGILLGVAPALIPLVTLRVRRRIREVRETAD